MVFSKTGVCLHPLHADAKRVLQSVQLQPLVLGEESRSNPAPACASGAPNPMDKILRRLGQIVVNDVGDVLDVNAAGREKLTKTFL